MPRLFGTNGVRGVVGESMTAELALDLGRALGTWLIGGGDAGGARPPGGRPLVMIGHDHRTSANMLVSAVTAGLLSTGCVVSHAGAAPTPAIQLAVRAAPDAAAGVIVTASHNPPEFNGIKFCRGDGREMMPDMEEAIEEVYFDRAFHAATWLDHQEVRSCGDVIAPYHAAIRGQVDAEAIARAGLSVVVDTANGAGCGSMPMLLRELGCRVVTVNAQPDGTFPGHPSEPTEENAGALMALVRETGADLGVLVDGDADRAVFVDETGVYHAGDKSLSILAASAVARAGGGVVCTPVSSSSCVEEAVAGAGGSVVYTVVGSPKVAAAMLETGAVFGGEENGGLIFPGLQLSRDAGMTAAAMVELLATTGEPLSVHAARVPERAVDKRKLEVRDQDKQALLTAVAAGVPVGTGPGGFEVRAVDARDGVKLLMDNGWVLVRASGTEPIVRVYAEAMDADTARARADAYVAFVGQVLATVAGA